MRVLLCLAAMGALCLTLTGCSGQAEPENSGPATVTSAAPGSGDALPGGAASPQAVKSDKELELNPNGTMVTPGSKLK